ncbi:MAG: pyridoxamine kinase [Peptoniphilaceae bacterium]|nr:pyridoxamine kinase [Peptoniphilaceae bacterium]MDY6085886.1 pyridoxamine kinase [Peptoniphilaceae bacterium]
MTRILTMQDLSCVGQCSLTVALPILSACGVEASVLPSAVLSTHTGGFTGFTFRDLTEDIPGILDHWVSESLDFAALYTGYLGSQRQIELVGEVQQRVLQEGAPSFIDPAMADNGQLYVGFDEDYVEAMKGLIAKADVALPNITEACFLTGESYHEQGDLEWYEFLCHQLMASGTKCVVLTGAAIDDETTGVLVVTQEGAEHYRHRRIEKGAHGTGDIFASAFVGSVMRGASLIQAAQIAADFTVDAIELTNQDPSHWYGARFEPCLGGLIDRVEAVCNL